MKIERLNPLEIIPIEAPHKKETVESLVNLYKDPQMKDALKEIVPFAFVHRTRDGLLYTVDGHHRIGVAHMFGKNVNAIFLNTFRDLDDAYVLADLGMIPKFELGFERDSLVSLATELPQIRGHAIARSVRSYDDFVGQIKQDKFWTYSLAEMCRLPYRGISYL